MARPSSTYNSYLSTRLMSAYAKHYNGRNNIGIYVLITKDPEFPELAHFGHVSLGRLLQRTKDNMKKERAIAARIAKAALIAKEELAAKEEVAALLIVAV